MVQFGSKMNLPSFGYRLVVSNYLEEGKVYFIGDGNTIVLGAGPKSEETLRKEQLRNEIRKWWWSDPKMRKWYEYIGEDWSHL